MLLQCIHCISSKSTLHPQVLRTFRITAAFYCTGNTEKQSPKSESMAESPPEKKTVWQKIKDTREKDMLIDKLPEKESLNTIFKVQRANSISIPKTFKTIYKFPKIKYFALVNRLKIYQVVVAGILSLWSGAFLIAGLEAPGFIYVATVLGISGCMTFYSVGFVAARFVGFIYYNKHTEMVRIAYVDSWGRRRDIECPVGDIVPFGEAPVNPMSKVWYTLRRFSTTETLKLQLEQGIIVDPKALEKILMIDLDQVLHK